MMMNSYWLVESSYYDDGTIAVRLAGSIWAEDCPENEKVSASEMDIYRDWFASRRLADRLVEAARDADAQGSPAYHRHSLFDGRVEC